jgi:hypothetical protein
VLAESDPQPLRNQRGALVAARDEREHEIGRDGGSACFGDSGGPALLRTTVIAVTNGGPPTCNGYNVYQRTDTANARGFLDDFLTVP